MLQLNKTYAIVDIVIMNFLGVKKVFYDSELEFLCEVFKKSHIQISLLNPTDPISKLIDKGLLSVLENSHITDMSINELFNDVKENTLYKSTDVFNLCYIYLILPETAEKTLLFIGPYIHTPLAHNQLLKNSGIPKISPKNQKLLSKYYTSIPVIEKNSHLFVMLDTFCEKIWGNNNFCAIDINRERRSPVCAISQESDNTLSQTLIDTELMERRYSYENEIIQAVTLGQAHKVDLLLSRMNEFSFEKRNNDPLRNMKNYCIIMNTLFRKAAEKGGVRPLYLDKVSSSFAVQIEQIPSVAEVAPLMREIFRSYCRLVRQHTMKNYSPIVQKTVIFIESDLAANLTLSSLAKVQNVSGGYLSTIFKKETGKTVTEYIHEKRIKHAQHLLNTTNLQIQTVALNCGIMDVQYFSKIFKKHTGKTPKEYRENAKKQYLKE